MSIRQLKSGSWEARVMIDGVNHRATLPTEAEARDWLTVTKARGITGVLPSQRVTVAEYAARWIAGYDTSPETTRRFHTGNLKLYILPRLGARPFARVVPSDVTRFLNGIKEDVSVAKAESVYRTLSALSASAAQDDVITRSPCRSKKHRPRRQKAPMTVLERDQAKAVLRLLSGWQRDAALLQLSLGARVGEIAGLTPHDVEGGRIAIVRRVYMSRSVRATKNHRRRVLEMPRAVVPTVERLVEQAGDPPPVPELDDREWPAEPWRRRWLVQTATGRPLNLASFNKVLHEACEEADVPDITSHGLRHTYVSWMIDEGHSADKIAFWIGDTPETVRRVYAHMLEGSSAPAAEAIDAALADL